MSTKPTTEARALIFETLACLQELAMAWVRRDYDRASEDDVADELHKFLELSDRLKRAAKAECEL